MPTRPLQISVQQFRLGATRAQSFLSYIVSYGISGGIPGREKNSQALLIDPRPELSQEYSDFASSRGLCLEKTLHTAEPDFRPGHEARLELGSVSLCALATPGICPRGVCLLGEGVLFTGNTLWIGFKQPVLETGSDVTELFKSLTMLKERVSLDTIVFPSYETGEQGFSLWRKELENNPDLRARSPAELREGKAREVDEELPSHASIPPEKLAHKLANLKDALLLDVREPQEFARGHIPGSLNLPSAELPFRAQELLSRSRIYLVCHSGRRSSRVAATLSYLGHKDVVVLTGGMQAWQNAELQMAK